MATGLNEIDRPDRSSIRRRRQGHSKALQRSLTAGRISRPMATGDRASAASPRRSLCVALKRLYDLGRDRRIQPNRDLTPQPGLLRRRPSPVCTSSPSESGIGFNAVGSWFHISAVASGYRPLSRSIRVWLLARPIPLFEAHPLKEIRCRIVSLVPIFRRVPNSLAHGYRLSGNCILR